MLRLFNCFNKCSSLTTTSSCIKYMDQIGGNNNNNKNHSNSIDNFNNLFNIHSTSKPIINQLKYTTSTSPQPLISQESNIHQLNKQIDKLLKIKNQPDNVKNYEDLISQIGLNDRVIIDGREYNQIDLHFKIIEIEPRNKEVYYSLFKLLESKQLKEIINTNSGETLSLKQILINSFSNNQDHLDSITRLCELVDPSDEIDINIYNKELNLDGTSFTFSQLSLALLAIRIDKYNLKALEIVRGYMAWYSLKELDNFYGEILSLKKSCELGYTATKKALSNGEDPFEPSAYLYFSGCLDPYEEYTLEDGTTTSKIPILLEGFEKYPNYPNFYHDLALTMTNNNQVIKIPFLEKILPKILNSNSSSKEIGRIELMKIGIYLKQKEINFETKNNQIPYLYIDLCQMLEKRDDTITLIGDNTTYTKFSLLIKTIESFETDQDIYFNARIELSQHMKPNEKVIINGESFSRYDILNHHETPYHLEMIAILKVLIEFCKQDGNTVELNHYENLLKDRKEEYKLGLLDNIENHPNIAENYYLLATEVLDDHGCVKLNVSNEECDKINLLLYSIQLNPTSPNYHLECANFMIRNKIFFSTDCHTCLLKEFQISQNNPKTYKSLKDVISLIHEYDLAPNNPDAFKEILEFLLKKSSYLANEKSFDESSIFHEDDFLFLEIYSKLIALEPNEASNYLEAGLILFKSSNDAISIDAPSNHLLDKYLFTPIQKLKYTRKQLFIKFIELECKYDPINGTLNKHPLAWYHLALEMKDDEVIFGKTKNQILLNIVDNIDSSFSRVYSELSTLDDHYDKRITLMIESIEIEGSPEIKSDHYKRLASYLTDNEETVYFANCGRNLNKQQLLIESIEIFPRKDHTSTVKLLADTLSSNDEDDTVTLFGTHYNQTQLLEIILDYLEDNPNYLESLKIKSNLFINNIKNLF